MVCPCIVSEFILCMVNNLNAPFVDPVIDNDEIWRRRAWTGLGRLLIAAPLGRGITVNPTHSDLESSPKKFCSNLHVEFDHIFEST